MKNTNTRRGFTQKVANKNCHPEFISGSTPLVTTQYKEEMLKQVQHDKGMGFTLIELLVVVLIIGILAAVAVPQYQKSVKKARLAEFISTSASITKAIDVWLLNNGYPDDYVWFSGKGDTSKTYSSLDIDLPCTKEDSSYCYNHLGGWGAYCMSTSCGINLYTGDNEKGESNKNTWLDKAFLSIRKRPSDENIWKMESVTQNTKLVCEAWKNSFGTEHMRDSLKETCVSLGIQ